MDAFAQKGFETIGALRTNRIIYPGQVRQQAKHLFMHFICCTVVGDVGDFDEGYRYFRNCVLQVALAQNQNAL